jgi:hypothetical protein
MNLRILRHARPLSWARRGTIRLTHRAFTAWCLVRLATVARILAAEVPGLHPDVPRQDLLCNSDGWADAVSVVIRDDRRGHYTAGALAWCGLFAWPGGVSTTYAGRVTPAMIRGLARVSKQFRGDVLLDTREAFRAWGPCWITRPDGTRQHLREPTLTEEASPFVRSPHLPAAMLTPGTGPHGEYTPRVVPPLRDVTAAVWRGERVNDLGDVQQPGERSHERSEGTVPAVEEPRPM